MTAGIPISKDTTLCVSLSARPSNLGTRFHNFLYAELGLDFVYQAFAPTDLGAAIQGVRGLGIRGVGVSMPFKEQAIDLVDSLDASAAVIASVNTIVNTEGHLAAYNTDVTAVATLLRERAVAPEQDFAVLGSGGMAKAVVAALRDAGFEHGVVVARNESTGRALAEQYGYPWVADLGTSTPRMLVNATPVGMSGGPAEHDLPVPLKVVQAAETVVEVVAMPARTPLVRAVTRPGATLITGTEVAALQALEQFVLYTGVRPTPDQVRRASEHARG